MLGMLFKVWCSSYGSVAEWVLSEYFLICVLGNSSWREETGNVWNQPGLYTPELPSIWHPE